MRPAGPWAQRRQAARGSTCAARRRRGAAGRSRSPSSRRRRRERGRPRRRRRAMLGGEGCHQSAPPTNPTGWCRARACHCGSARQCPSRSRRKRTASCVRGARSGRPEAKASCRSHRARSTRPALPAAREGSAQRGPEPVGLGREMHCGDAWRTPPYRAPIAAPDPPDWRRSDWCAPP